MNTIQQIVVEADLSDVDGLITTLVAREQEMAETLQVIGSQFGLMPQIVAKVICQLGMGDPCTGEMREHVDAQYALLLTQIEENRQQQNAKYEEMGIPVRVAPFEDPLAEGAPDIMADLDSPPES
jgi:hypothetical protein